MVKNTYGTGCFMLMNIGDKPIISKNNLITTIAWQINNKVEYALEGSIFMAGATVQWLRDELKIITSSADVEKLAATVPDNGGVYLVPAFAGIRRAALEPACTRHDGGNDTRNFCGTILPVLHSKASRFKLWMC